MLNLLKEKISENFTPEVVLNIVSKKSEFLNPIIKEISFGSPTKKGDSYLSVVTRFCIEITDKNEDKVNNVIESIPVITKSFPANLARKETFRSVDFFKTEIAFYTKVWPCLDAFQRSKNVQNPVNIIPECFVAITDGKSDFIALEDLSYKDYNVIERNAGLNYEQTVEIIRTFGKFHALSIAFNDQKPKEFQTFIDALNETYFGEQFRNWYTPVMKKVLLVLKDAVEKELGNEYVNKLDDLMKRDMFGECCQICKNHSILCGVTHGDCWAPNFLIKHTNNTQMDIKIIDYQLSRCAPVITDLTFFLYVCVDPLIRDQHWNELIKIYSDSVSRYLQELGSDGNLISVDKVEDAMKKIGMFTLVMGAEAIIMSAAEEVADIDEIREPTTLDNVWIIKPMSNEENRKKVAGFFKHLVDGQYV